MSLIHFNIIFSDKGHNGPNKIAYYQVLYAFLVKLWLKTYILLFLAIKLIAASTEKEQG